MTEFHNTDKKVSYCDYFILLSVATENEGWLWGEVWGKSNLRLRWPKILCHSWLHWKMSL